MNAVANSGGNALPSKPRWFRYLWALIIFGCGVVTGMGIGVMGLHAFMSYQFRNPELMYTRLVQRLTEGLNVTPGQQQRIDGVVHQKQAEFQRLFSVDFPALGNAHFDGLRDAVAAILTPQQAELWRANFEKARSQAFPPFPPPPGDGPFGSHAPTTPPKAPK